MAAMGSRSKEKTTTTVLPARREEQAHIQLAGEDHIDEALLEKAVAEINRIYVLKGLETTRAISNYFVGAFFGCDMEAFRQREKKHVTFRALANREEFHVAYNTIWYSVAVLGQLRQLPENIAEALPLTHHKLLLPVHDVQTKVELAQRAVDEGLSSRDFAEAVKEVRASDQKGGRRGRAPLPAFVKGITRLRRAVKLATSEEITPEALASYSPDRARKTVEDLEEQINRLVELKEKVLRAVDAPGDTAS